MKATGIVRRIDDLGRVVIPKEIRKTLRIREGDSLEIYTENAGEIILKKYSPIQELKALAQPYAESLSLTSGSVVAVADRDCIVATSQGGKKDFEHKMLSREMEKTILGRKKIMAQGDSKDDVPPKSKTALPTSASIFTITASVPLMCRIVGRFRRPTLSWKQEKA